MPLFPGYRVVPRCDICWLCQFRLASPMNCLLQRYFLWDGDLACRRAAHDESSCRCPWKLLLRTVSSCPLVRCAISVGTPGVVTRTPGYRRSIADDHRLLGTYRSFKLKVVVAPNPPACTPVPPAMVSSQYGDATLCVRMSRSHETVAFLAAIDTVSLDPNPQRWSLTSLSRMPVLSTFHRINDTFAVPTH